MLYGYTEVILNNYKILCTQPVLTGSLTTPSLSASGSQASPILSLSASSCPLLGTMGQLSCGGRGTHEHLLPTGSEERGVLGVQSIPGAILPSCQDSFFLFFFY